MTKEAYMNKVLHVFVFNDSPVPPHLKEYEFVSTSDATVLEKAQIVINNALANNYQSTLAIGQSIALYAIRVLVKRGLVPAQVFLIHKDKVIPLDDNGSGEIYIDIYIDWAFDDFLCDLMGATRFDP
jgi:hypothetical protein